MYTCAVLTGVATGGGLALLLDELAWHVASSRSAASLAGIALGLGVLAGLWLPRRMLRRLEADVREGDADTGAPAAIEHAFAAALSGGLLLAMALLWTLLQAGATALEAYRGWLAVRVLLPATPAKVLLLGPLLAGMFVLGLTGTLALVAVQGWYGLVAAPRPRSARLMMGLIAGAAAGLMLNALGSSAATSRFISLLAAFLAGLAAVSWPARGSGAAGPRAHAVPTGELIGPLLRAGLAGMLAAVALVTALEPARAGGVHSATGLLLGTVAGLLGMLTARGWLHVGRRMDLVPSVCLVMAALALLIPVGPDELLGVAAAQWRAALVAGPAGACIVLVGSAVARRFRRAQPALAGIGGALAAGVVVGCLAVGVWSSATIARTVAPLLSLAAVIAAVVPGLAARGAPVQMRGVALGLVAAVAALAYWSGRAGSPAPAQSATRPAGLIWQTLLAEGPESGQCAAPRHAGDAAALDIDWGGPRYDVLVIVGDTSDLATARRFARRCASAVRPGGFTVFALPADNLAHAAFRRQGGAVHRVRLIAAGEAHTALVLGPDPRPWLARHVPEQYASDVRPVASFAALQHADEP